MELTTGLVVGVGLFLLLLVPFLVFAIRRGRAHGHTWFTGSSHAATAISALMWVFATRSRE